MEAVREEGGEERGGEGRERGGKGRKGEERGEEADITFLFCPPCKTGREDTSLLTCHHSQSQLL